MQVGQYGKVNLKTYLQICIKFNQKNQMYDVSKQFLPYLIMLSVF